ncbi:DUF4097 family beta strand repeat-containing protein [Actinacidiphila rubida]|uniref:DUF4097 domain-containing protein n=1 Tax=Actinacidiphila rubida TaxID=310780 RepID=A0A1H8KYE0_9ACTN|nr:DUF4097 family beta strand repeat-containing protein [Actinacidiphila rubida]SEN97905.1 hypothetical protein SAMN05216267_1014143 [Actinacidiphila rubida]
MQTFDTPAAVSAVLALPAGRIRLVAADRADTTVEVLPADASKSRDVKAAEQVEVAFADGVLRIGTAAAKHRILGDSGSVEVTVHLPAGSAVEATAAAAEFHGSGRLGDVAFDGAQATVALDETAGARVTLQDGGVSIGRLGGSARISTMRGDIDIAEAVAGTVTLTTQQGSISVAAAPGVSASLDAGTASGRITNTLRNADGAAAGLTFHATTAQGDITARGL